MSVPFENEYNLRLVAGSQAKSCMICYKPSDHVLITNNNLDFFYVCYHHLLDEHFASHIPNDSYNNLIKEQKALQLLIDELNDQAEKIKPSILSNIPGFKLKPKLKEDTPDSSKPNYDQLIKDKQENEKKLTELNDKISQFKFKQYKLNGDFYKIRIKLYINKKMNEKRMKEMNNPGFFPSAPKNAPGMSKDTNSNDASNDNDSNNDVGA